MATYKTTSSNTVIAKVIRDFGLTGNNWKLDAIEWIGETIRCIGYHAGFEKKSVSVKSINHRIYYPCDFESLLGIEHRGSKLNEGGSIRYGKFDNLSLNEESFNNDAFPLIINSQKVEETVHHVGCNGNEYYLRNPDYIITSFVSDIVTLHYMAYVTDENGFPKVPDTYEVMECMAFYIMYKWLSKGNIHVQWTLRDTKMEYERFLGKAENRMFYPNLDEMDRFANMWSRMVPDPYLPDKFFIGTETKQTLNNI